MKRLAHQGYFLIFSLLVLTGLTALTTVSITRSTMDLAAANRFVALQQTFALAESGADCAIQGLQFNPSNAAVDAACSVSSVPGGTLAMAISNDSVGPTRRTIQSIATMPGAGTQELRTVVSRTLSSPFQQAAYGLDDVTVTSGALVDSYKSSLGSIPMGGGTTYGQTLSTSDPNYGTLNKSQEDDLDGSSWHAEVRTNGTASGSILVQEASGGTEAKVHGPASTPVGASAVTVGTGGSLSGASGTKSAQTFADVQPPDPPVGCTSYPPFTGGEPPINDACVVTPSITLDGSTDVLRFTNPNLQLFVNGNTSITNGGNLNIAWGTMRTGDLTMDGGSSTLRGTGGLVQLYTTGVVKVESNAVIKGYNSLPRNLRLYSSYEYNPNVTNPGIWILSNAKVYGTLYAPQAGVKLWGLGGPGEVFGGVVGKTVEIWTLGAAVHYDEDLASASMQWPSWMKANVSVLAQGANLPLPPPPPPVCGDGLCNGSETSASCPLDCGGGGTE